MTGKIKKLSEKGYGFIALEGREKDLFFHSKDLLGIEFINLQEGDMVEVEGIEPTARGDKAYGVRIAAS